MRRIVILGPPGSGKSTLAAPPRGEARCAGLPPRSGVLAPRPGRASADAFRGEAERIAALPDWIIDGDDTETIAPRLAAEDTSIYLDVPSRLAVARILRRALASHGRVRPDTAAGCPGRIGLDFLALRLGLEPGAACAGPRRAYGGAA